ncbi:hypothetical protein ACKP2L_03715 [Oenococcus alcoholitolerans]|uniref:Carbohydrate ABC transporter permease n=1 Tax=Oenococcus alcoholitolerans TaxID=931074 RepID=A0ABR4XPZ8_9LACO|nr:hypothetical protein Q757_06620 [Oenococcus alcoholitolerans]
MKKIDITKIRPQNHVKSSLSTRLFNILDLALMLIFTLIIFIPMWNILVSSFAANNANSFIFWPNKLSIANYISVMSDPGIWQSMWVSVAKTVIGVIFHLIMCSIVAYALSKRNLKGRNLYTSMGVITMFFSGGMIPTYLYF